jgi:hypothetical protein
VDDDPGTFPGRSMHVEGATDLIDPFAHRGQPEPAVE